MAVFLLKSRARVVLHTADLHRQNFGDVPCPSLFADWIEQLLQNPSPAAAVAATTARTTRTRGQMAVFLSITFGLF